MIQTRPTTQPATLVYLYLAPSFFLYGIFSGFFLWNSISAPSIPALLITPAVPSSQTHLNIWAPIGLTVYLSLKPRRLNLSRFTRSRNAATSRLPPSGCCSTNTEYRWYGLPFCAYGGSHGKTIWVSRESFDNGSEVDDGEMGILAARKWQR